MVSISKQIPSLNILNLLRIKQFLKRFFPNIMQKLCIFRCRSLYFLMYSHLNLSKVLVSVYRFNTKSSPGETINKNVKYIVIPLPGVSFHKVGTFVGSSVLCLPIQTSAVPSMYPFSEGIERKTHAVFSWFQRHRVAGRPLHSPPSRALVP